MIAEHGYKGEQMQRNHGGAESYMTSDTASDKMKKQGTKNSGEHIHMQINTAPRTTSTVTFR